ncbi:RHS domain-containing protein [Pseudomonas cerasi]
MKISRKRSTDPSGFCYASIVFIRCLACSSSHSDSQSYEPLARIDGVEGPEIYWFHTAANGMPERLTDSEGRISWEGFSTPW